MFRCCEDLLITKKDKEKKERNEKRRERTIYQAK
jgi:hypothetical protein